jgi:eukaryotic-like serine/threonine-protein kinase
MAEPQGNARPRLIGRYELYGEIAHGGMATVHVGRIISDAGFSRTVAIKRLHPYCAKDPAFAAMFIDEARLASRIHHPNVVSTLDVVATEEELFVVMDFVQGESLSHLIRVANARGTLIPVEFVCTIVAGMLDGLHAAHEAVNELDEPLGIVHRDVSPQNVLVGIDGIPRLIDFGVAKASGRLSTTREGQLKGKLSYMPPEQFEGEPADRRGDVYSAAVVLWEALVGKRLFDGKTEAETLRRIMAGPTERPSDSAAGVPMSLDDVVMRGLSRDPSERFATAREMALAIESSATLAPTRKVGEWVRAMAADSLAQRAKRIVEIESQASSGVNVASLTEGIALAPRPGERTPSPPARSDRPFGSHQDASLKGGRASASSQHGPTLKIVPRVGTVPPKAPSHLPDVEASPRRIARPSSPDVREATTATPEPLDRPTPVDPVPRISVPTPLVPMVPASVPAMTVPLAPSSASALPATSPSAAAPSAGSSAAPSSIETTWSEKWDGTAWEIVRRPVSPVIVAVVALLAVLLAALLVSQRQLFGVEGSIGLGVGLFTACGALLLMVRSTRFRLDKKELLIEHRPSGRSTSIETQHINRFIVIEEGPRKQSDVFSVHLLPFNGDVKRIEVDFDSDAEARWVMQRLNEMLAQVRGSSPPIGRPS